MSRIRVLRYLRRRLPAVKIYMGKARSQLRTRNDPVGPLGSTAIVPGLGGGKFGQSKVFLSTHVWRLKRDAKHLAFKLKDEHIRDDIIDTIIHESLHSAIAVYGRKPGPMHSSHRRVEEHLVNVITEDIMTEIRAAPRIPFPGEPEHELRAFKANPTLDDFIDGYKSRQYRQGHP